MNVSLPIALLLLYAFIQETCKHAKYPLLSSRAARGRGVLCGDRGRVITYPRHEAAGEQGVWQGAQHHTQCRRGCGQGMCSPGKHALALSDITSEVENLGAVIVELA
jgi:hypothetical protein